MLPLASLIKGVELENLPDLVRYLKIQIQKLGVNVQLGKEFTVSTAEKYTPDVIILAAGGTLTIPEIKGIDNPRVLTPPVLHQKVKPYLRLFGPRLLGWLTRYWLPVGKNVVIIGGGLHGCEIAEFLIKRGRKVTIVEQDEQIGAEVLDFRLGLTMDWFERRKITVITGVKEMEIINQGLKLTDRQGNEQVIPVNNIIPTRPLVANLELIEKLTDKVP